MDYASKVIGADVIATGHKFNYYFSLMRLRDNVHTFVNNS